MSTNIATGAVQPRTAKQVVDALADARRLGSTVQTHWAPASAEEAYAAQRDVRATLGERIGGWKAAGLDPAGIPLVAAIHASDVCPSGAFRCCEGGWVLEVEYGFRLGRDLPSAPTLTARDIMAAVDTVHVCFELCRSRLALSSPPRLLFLADSLANDRLIVGTGVSARDLSLGDRTARLTIDGELVKQTQTPPADAAAEVFYWLARQPLPEGGLRAGQIAITGSLTGTVTLRPGQVAEASIDGVGQANVEALA